MEEKTALHPSVLSQHSDSFSIPLFNPIKLCYFWMKKPNGLKS